MIDHTGVVVADLEKSRNFYSAALGSIGLVILMELPASVAAALRRLRLRSRRP